MVWSEESRRECKVVHKLNERRRFICQDGEPDAQAPEFRDQVLREEYTDTLMNISDLAMRWENLEITITMPKDDVEEGSSVGEDVGFESSVN